MQQKESNSEIIHLWEGGQLGDDSCELEVKGEAVVGKVLHLKSYTRKLSSVLCSGSGL
jgi:hypothetical protein